MNFSEDILQYIEDYLNGNLNAEETLAFENRIKNNQDLAEAIAINKKMRLQYSDDDWDFIKDDKNNKEINELELLLKSNNFQDKKKAIQSASELYFKKEQTQNSKNTKSKLYYALAIAASLIIFFGIFFKSNSPTNQEIYSNYSSWEELPSLVSRSETNSVLLSKGENAFTNKDFKIAEENFTTYTNNQIEVNVNALLYLGISQLELEDYDAAVESFDKIIASNTIDQSKGYWYKSLVYLKNEDKHNAEKTLKIIISNPDYFNYSKAKELLEALN